MSAVRPFLFLTMIISGNGICSIEIKRKTPQKSFYSHDQRELTLMVKMQRDRSERNIIIQQQQTQLTEQIRGR